MTIALGLLLCLQDLNDETFDKLRDLIRPAEAELKWRSVPWRPTLWDGLRDAHESGKPILLWAMNGHPLALC